MEKDCNLCDGTPFSYDCPAQIALPFFGTWGIIATIALIIGVYLVLNLRTEKRKKR